MAFASSLNNKTLIGNAWHIASYLLFAMSINLYSCAQQPEQESTQEPIQETALSIDMNNPPKTKPTVTTKKAICFRLFAVSIAGFSSDQNEADIIIPDAIPSDASIKFLLIFFIKNTMLEPNIVNNHVKIVAIKA